jgi:hypothetical protein
LVVSVFQQGGVAAAPTDTQGTTYTLGARHTSGTDHCVAIYYGVAGSTGANSVLVPGSVNSGVVFSEIANVHNTVNTTAQGYTSVTPSTVTLTTTVPGTFIYVSCGNPHNATTFTGITGTTASIQANGSDAVVGGVASGPAAGAITVGYNITSIDVSNSPIAAVAFTTADVTPDLDPTNWMAFGASGGGAVTSLNSLTGALNIVAGANVTVTPSGSSVTIAASGGGGGGSSFPWTVVQEDKYTNASAGSTITVTFPQATAASGNTAFILIGFGGNVTPTFPTGWTVDLNVVGGADARFALLHKATASDTSATFSSSGADGYSVLFFEIVGSHSLDASSTGSVSGTFSGNITMPAITVSANSVVFGVICSLVSSATTVPSALPTMSPSWRVISGNVGNFNGSRFMTGHMGTVAASAGSVTPPVINIPNPTAFFSGGGTAYASFSIL